VEKSLEPYRDRLVRDVTGEDVEKLLEIRIKRISRYDIDKKRQDIKTVQKSIKDVENHLKDMVKFTINYLDDLLARYGEQYPRKTRIETFNEVEVRKVALSNLTVGYDQESGFLGYQVKARPENSFACSEYDRLLLIYRNGVYKAINVIDKLFVGLDLAWVGKVEEKLIFNVIYRDGEHNLCNIKRFQTPKFILDKEYHLFPEHKRSEILYLKLGEPPRVRIHFAPSKRAKANYADYDFNDYLIKGSNAIGKRVSNRVVRRIVDQSVEQPNQDKAAHQEPQLGLFRKKETPEGN
jgi:topoisomerase-4 subunit A